jgi:hypothetical protein
MKQISTEKFIEKIGVNVYPITIIKFLLNKRRILSYFNRASNKNFELRGNKYLIDNTDCELCKLKQQENTVLCRQHTSISRVLTGENVGFDSDTGTFFLKNEIFQKVDNKLVIVYCPHPKLIKVIGEEITDANVRKVNPITIEDPKLEFPRYKSIIQFSSNDLLEQHMKCWFNDTFSIITIPEDRNYSNWCLVPNK